MTERCTFLVTLTTNDDDEYVVGVALPDGQMSLAPETALRFARSLDGAVAAAVAEGYELDKSAIEEFGTWTKRVPV